MRVCMALVLSVIPVAIMFVVKARFGDILLLSSVSAAFLFSIVGGSRRVFYTAVYGLSVFAIVVGIGSYRSIMHHITVDADDMCMLPVMFLLTVILPVCITWIIDKSAKWFTHKVQVFLASGPLPSPSTDESQQLTLLTCLVVLIGCLAVSVILATIVVIGVAIFLACWNVALTGASFDQALHRTYAWLENQMIVSQLAFSFWALFSVGWVKWRSRVPLWRLGFQRDRALSNSCIGSTLGVLVHILAAACYVGVLLVAGWVCRQPVLSVVYHHLKADQSFTQFGHFLSFASLSPLLTGPVTEEVIFRGLLYSSLRTRFHVVSSVVISSTAFAAMHLHLYAAPVYFVAGAVAALLLERRKSLITPISFHIAGNAVAMLLRQL